MAGMPKQGYTNLVLAGWVPDPALGCEALGGPWGGLVALGMLHWPPQGYREMEVEGRKKTRREERQKARLRQRRNLIRPELYSPAKDIGYFRDIGKK